MSKFGFLSGDKIQEDDATVSTVASSIGPYLRFLVVQNPNNWMENCGVFDCETQEICTFSADFRYLCDDYRNRLNGNASFKGEGLWNPVIEGDWIVIHE